MYEVIAQREGPLFMDPDADKARAFFRKKKRSLANKVMPLKDAIAQFVHDGDYLCIGGFGANRTPVAACHEIVREKESGILRPHVHPRLPDSGCGEDLNRCDIAYIIGIEIRGLSPNARRYSESGKVQFCEWTNYALALPIEGGSDGSVVSGAQCHGDGYV